LVVSIDISGKLEEKLRRLVELGIYASVSEAVREAVRKLLQEIDMKRIALDIYIDKGSTLYYASQLAEAPLEVFIEYLIVNDVYPAIGVKPEEPVETLPPGSKLLFDPLSLYVIYNSKMHDLLEGLTKYYELYYPSPLENYWTLLTIKRASKQRNAFVSLKPLKIREKQPPPQEYITPVEYALSGQDGYVIISDDINYRRKYGGTPSLALLASYIKHRLGPMDRYILKEIIVSMRFIPYLIPGDLEEGLLRMV